MPRSTLAKRSAYWFDKNLELRNSQNPAISSSTAENPIQFSAGSQEEFTCVVVSQPYTGYTLDTSEWQIIVEVSTQLAGTYRQVGIAKLNGATGGNVLIPLSGIYVESSLPQAQYIRVRSAKVNSPGNLTYGAFLSMEAY